VAVYFKGERLATGVGHSIQQAEMSAATNAIHEKAGNVYRFYVRDKPMSQI